MYQEEMESNEIFYSNNQPKTEGDFNDDNFLDTEIKKLSVNNEVPVSCLITGSPITNGFLTNKVNPILDSKYAYLNRNKLVNRRLIIKKIFQNSTGLQSIGKQSGNDDSIKKKTEFFLANPNSLNEFRTLQNLNLLAQLNNHRLSMTTVNNLLNTLKSTSEKLNEKFAAELNDLDLADNLLINKTSAITVLEENKIVPDKIDGPTPVSYHVPRLPPNHKSAPMYTMGRRCFNEKDGGARTSWTKEWYNSSHPFSIKSDFKREARWPSPTNYKIKTTIGPEANHVLYHQNPVHTFGIKQNVNFLSNRDNVTVTKLPKSECASCNMILSRDDIIEKEYIKTSIQIKHENQPVNNQHHDHFKSMPEEMDVMQSVNYVSSSSPKVSIQFRQKGTQLWPKSETTPGPGSYDHSKFQNVKRSKPKFTVPSARHELNSSFNVGPFAAL